MQRGEIWFAATPGGDRPVLVLTRDPIADRIGSVVVVALARTRRGLASELALMLAGQSKGTSPKLCPEGSLDSNKCSYGQLEGEESRTGEPALVGHILGSAPDRDMGGATGPSRQANPIRRRPIRYECEGARVVTLTPWLTPWSKPTG